MCRENIERLQQFTKLKSLTIKNYRAKYIGRNGLSGLVELRALKLPIHQRSNYEDFMELDYDLACIAQKLKSLEKFREFCLDFVEHAKNLKEFKFYKCRVRAAVEFVTELMSVGNEHLEKNSDEKCTFDGFALSD